MRDHALREQALERLGDADLADMGERPRPEAGVEQVKDRMLDPADILADRQPALGLGAVERLIVRLAGEADEIPARIHEGIERVRLAQRRLAALGAVDMLPRRVAVERIAGDVETDILGQHDRQLVLRNRHNAAVGAMDERDRRAPVALAGDAPVAQAPHGRAFAPALGFGAADDFGLGLFHAHAVEEARVHQPPGAGIGLVLDRGLFLALRRDNALDRQHVLAREIEVALVVRRAAEDGASAIVHQHEIGDEQRQLPVGIEGVDHGQAGVEAFLFLRLHLCGSRARAAAFLGEGSKRGIVLGQRQRNRVIGGDGSKARAEQRVRPGGEDLQLIDAGDRSVELEAELHTLRFADPVLLHQTNLLGPFVQRAEAGEQIVGKIGDLEEPLVELALLDQRARTPAAPVDHLLIGEHGHVDRVPVHRAFLAVDKAGLVQVDEQRLFLAVIIRLAGRQFAAPVEREAEALELRLHRGDVVPRPAAGMDLLLHRRILGRHAEGVPAHRVQHVMALHPAEAGQHVAH